MKKIILVVLLGMALTFFASWIGSREMKKETNSKQENIIKKQSEQTSNKKWDTYTGNWVGQDNTSIRVIVMKQNQKTPSYKITIYQNGNQTCTFSAQVDTNGEGVVTDQSGVTYHLEFTQYYENKTQSKPAVEIYSSSNGTENATDQNFFIRAFR